jgi:hypothetical protein
VLTRLKLGEKLPLHLQAPGQRPVWRTILPGAPMKVATMVEHNHCVYEEGKNSGLDGSRSGFAMLRKDPGTNESTSFRTGR